MNALIVTSTFQKFVAAFLIEISTKSLPDYCGCSVTGSTYSPVNKIARLQPGQIRFLEYFTIYLLNFLKLMCNYNVTVRIFELTQYSSNLVLHIQARFHSIVNPLLTSIHLSTSPLVLQQHGQT